MATVAGVADDPADPATSSGVGHRFVVTTIGLPFSVVPFAAGVDLRFSNDWRERIFRKAAIDLFG